jgi:hypothetical protein
MTESGDDRLHRATIEFGLDAEKADLFERAASLIDDIDGDLHELVTALDDSEVAMALWTRWSDEESIAEHLDALLDRLDAETDENPGVVWLRARNLARHGRTDESIALLDNGSEHPLIQVERAAVAADRSDATIARDLLQQAGVDVDVDLDAEYDPSQPGGSFGRELAEEIAPFAAIRPPAMAGRNDPCPCGSGNKYKRCHLGNEMHPLADRANWLYIKLMRFMQVFDPIRPTDIAEHVVETVEDDDLRQMVHDSYLGIDLALFEGGIAQRFLDAKRSVLPTDEAELLDAWISQDRSVFEVTRSRPGVMDVIDLATNETRTIVDTVPDEPLEAGWKLIGRLVPVNDTYRSFGGFLPINDDMVPSMLQGFATRDLDTVATTIGQIFDTAVTQDQIQDLFAESLDTGELSELIAELERDSD